MGLIIGTGSNRPTWPYDHYYGVEWDTTVSSPSCTRIGKSELHVSLPIQSKMRRCLLNDAGEVVTYLGANDSTKTDTGAAADLTGASGQVMVEIPKHYRKFEAEGTKWRCFISEVALPSFHEVPKQYISAYEACVDRSVAATPKLCSVVNTATTHRGGISTSAWDDTYRSCLGMPGTGISLTNFRTYARNRGASGNTEWNCNVYSTHKALYWLFVVEYATFNSQEAFTNELTAEGYKKGGLGSGVTTINSTKWNTYNSYNPFIPCGTTNSLGNKSGVVTFSFDAEQQEAYGGTFSCDIPSYRGVENPFGHINKHTDGALIKVVSGDTENTCELYTCDDPSKFSSSVTSDYVRRAETAKADGYGKKLPVGEFGELCATETGGSATTYQCDYFYINNATGGAARALLFGGIANYGSSAGLAFVNAYYAPSDTLAYVGSRLCFIPANA